MQELAEQIENASKIIASLIHKTVELPLAYNLEVLPRLDNAHWLPRAIPQLLVFALVFI